MNKPISQNVKQLSIIKRSKKKIKSIDRCFSQSQPAVVVALTAAPPRFCPLWLNVDFLTLVTENDDEQKTKNPEFWSKVPSRELGSKFLYGVCSCWPASDWLLFARRASFKQQCRWPHAESTAFHNEWTFPHLAEFQKRSSKQQKKKI